MSGLTVTCLDGPSAGRTYPGVQGKRIVVIVQMENFRCYEIEYDFLFPIVDGRVNARMDRKSINRWAQIRNKISKE